jgi:dsRNA-specific ribonuclease
VSCEVPALGLSGEGRGSSRRRAEQEAAERILSDLNPATDVRHD